MHSIRWVYLAAGLLAAPVLAGLAGCQRAASSEAPPAPPPPVVYFATPLVKEVTDYEDFTGHTQAVKMVIVRARVTGYLTKLNFEDGTEVREGDVLFEIDPRPYQDAYNASVAQVALNEANLKLAMANNERYKALFKSNPGAVSMQDLDLYQAQQEQAVANLNLSKAQRDTALRNLDWTRVTAPFSGRISARLIDPGNEVIADTTPLTTIVAEDPIYGVFDIDEHTLQRIKRLTRPAAIGSSANASSASHALSKLSMALTDEDEFTHQGMIDFEDNQVDPQTGTLRIRGVFPNADHAISKPQLFARFRLPIGQPHPAIVIPERALSTDQGRKFVYVIDKDNKATYRKVTVGQPYGDRMRIINDGLQSGEKIVVSGLQRIMKADMTVAPKPESEEPSEAKPGDTKPAAKKPAEKRPETPATK